MKLKPIEENSQYYIKKCVICNKSTNNGNIFCKDCWYKAKDLSSKFYYEHSQIKLEQCYEKLKKEAFLSRDKTEIQNKILHLYATADAYTLLYGTELLEKARIDIIEILENFNNNCLDFNNKNGIAKKCEICGQYSSKYPLCEYHNDMKTMGLIEKEENGSWIVLDNDDKCLICNEETNNGNLFCKKCYQKIKKERINFDHNRKEKRIVDHYFELKNSLQDSKSKNEFNEKIMLMWALSEEHNYMYEEDYLSNRVKADILKEFKKFDKQEVENNNHTFNDEDFRNKWPREHQCDDGHYVRSFSEMLIDNWLYNNGYVHAYEKSVFMETNPEAVVLSDFYLPKGNVYIEHWGIEDDEKYLKRREIKTKLYDENNYNRIDLVEKDIKRLNDILPRLISKYIKK